MEKEQYTPIKLINTSLEDSEYHFYSFSAVVVEKNWLGYSATGASYTIYHVLDMLVHFAVGQKFHSFSSVL